jgi:hypothetical protein
LLINDFRKNYIGLTANWCTKYVSARKVDDSSIRVMLELLTPLRLLRPVHIWCVVDLSEYKQFSVLKRRARIRITGNIAELEWDSITLSNVTLYFE